MNKIEELGFRIDALMKQECIHISSEIRNKILYLCATFAMTQAADQAKEIVDKMLMPRMLIKINDDGSLQILDDDCDKIKEDKV